MRRAYRRLARLYHPDVNLRDAGSVDRFENIQNASRAINGETEVSVEPTSGVWWRFVGFSTPDSLRRADFAVTAVTFEVRDLHRMPLGQVEDDVRISYAGQILPLAVKFTGSRFASSVWSARLGAAAESAFLVLLCLAVFPVIAVLLSLDVFVISNENVYLTWAIAVVILGAGYGALAAILATAGRRVPFPRRAVLRTRAAVADLRGLSKGRTT